LPWMTSVIDSADLLWDIRDLATAWHRLSAG
jgi:hypothetical protein